MKKHILLQLSLGLIITSVAHAATNYTVLDADQYRETVNHARTRVQQLLTELKPYRLQDRNTQLAFIANQLTDIPYSRIHTIGEGDWQPHSPIYKPGALHLNQNPVYRFDYLNCQTLVQVTMALLYSQNLNQFDKNILKISYGAAGNPDGEIVHYYNRNHFIDADLNPINEKNGWLTDVTTQGDLASFKEMTTATLTRQQWFSTQQKNLKNIVQVLSDRDGDAMVKRFQTVYSHLNFPHFTREKIRLAYIPKTALVITQANGSYHPNQALLDAIPTPAIAEIVSDTKKWMVNHENIKTRIGTELNIPHLGFVYRKTFHRGDVIYQQIHCEEDTGSHKTCSVTPVVCQETQCKELMFVDATDRHPNGHYWYRENNGRYVCSAERPSDDRHYTTCNRVENIPLFAYLTDYQYAHYRYMKNPAILGIHFEKLR
jgi:hypothetical protein